MANNTNYFDVIIVGGGVIGASILHHLVKEGYKTALFDKNKLVSGCTSLSGGIVRGFHSNSELSDKGLYGWQYYKNFEINTGIASQFIESGFVYFPSLNQIDYAKNEVGRLADHMPIQWLDPHELQCRWGDVFATHGAVYEPHSGYMDAIEVSHAWINSAKQAGGQVYENVSIEKIDFSSGNIDTILSSSGKFKSKCVVLALGAYTPQFLDQHNIKHQLYTQVIQVDVRRPTIFNSDQPAFIDDYYNLNGRPDPDLKAYYIGHPTNLKIKNPENYLNFDSNHASKIYLQGEKRWKWVAQSDYCKTLRVPDCYIKDGLGFVQGINEVPNVFVATGFNGGGFKMAPWIGNEIKRLVKQIF